MLSSAGGTNWRVGFNAGDRAFHFGPSTYIPYLDTLENWSATFARLCDEHGFTDLILYGDARPVHQQAIAIAHDLGITVHVFEEGYLRPYWVTYERNGSNGYSRLMDISVDDMRETLAVTDMEVPSPPAHWGDLRQHVFYGALYHWFVLFRNRPYAKMARHRALTVFQEAKLYSKRLFIMPIQAAKRAYTTRRVKNGGYPFHMALLQLEHDASFQTHSDYGTMAAFIADVVAGFANGAPSHHHLVFKAHPLETGQLPLRQIIRQHATDLGVLDRVHFVRGGKLAQLLDHARSAVTINSTAGQQVLWRGIPLKAFGRAVYDKPEFVSSQPLDAFFADPDRPDGRAYREFRQYLLETCQLPGSFYATKGRRQLLREVVDLILAPSDPYDRLAAGKAPPRQPITQID